MTPDLVVTDPFLLPYREHVERRRRRVAELAAEIRQESGSLEAFSSGHDYFGLHVRNDRWTLREWAPNATAIYLIGEFNQWQERSEYPLHRINDHGIWEADVPTVALRHGQLYRLSVYWDGGHGHRIPTYARRVVQDEGTNIFNAQVWRPELSYKWRCPGFVRPAAPPLIYEAHVGMAQEEGKVGSFWEFKEYIIPRIVAAGYNVLQLMAIPEHPYYGSFGYHVSSYFAPSSRFGTPEEFKELIDTAHAAGLAVIIDLVHSHAVRNEIEGLSRFDGTEFQFFHQGGRGYHETWDSRCFDYGKKEVLHFLLSNCRYWLDEFRVDGFRFDGVTSMLYRHHGLNKAFTHYDDYFNDQVDEDAIVYLILANTLIHRLRPDALTIAEDMSGMPGMAFPPEQGGIGFDYRLGMGLPDYWIKLTKDVADEHWHLSSLWYQLTNRRAGEKTIAYSESHDQALVGDQTLIFRLVGADMYHDMEIGRENLRVDRGIALHKLIRLLTLAAGGEGYLNFMGNEFGHPEWIDFPREGNQWSYHYARRQWRLRDDGRLRYRQLALFDEALIALAKQHRLLATGHCDLLQEHNDQKILAFRRGGLCFIFNFHPSVSYVDYEIPVAAGVYTLLLDSDKAEFGGHGRIAAGQEYFSQPAAGAGERRMVICAYLPTRTAIVMRHNPVVGDEGQRQ